MSPRRRRARAGLAMCALLVASFAGSPAAAGVPEPSIGLVEQAAWVRLGGYTTLRLDIPAAELPPGEVSLRFRLHNRLTSYDAFTRSIADDRLPSRVATMRLPVGLLPRDEQGNVLVTFGVGPSDTTPALPANRAGVYPLEVALEGDDTLASFVTWLVVVDPAATDEEGLPVAWVWHVVSDPVRGVDGEPAPGVVSELAPGGRLDAVAGVLDAATDLPMTLHVGPETVESWATLAAADPSFEPGLRRVVDAVARPTTQLLPAPYVPTDLTALEAAGLGGELPDQLVAGADALERVTGVAPDPRTVFLDPVDVPTLARLRGLLVDRVVVRDGAVDEDEPPTARAPFALPAGATDMRATTTSAAVEALLRGPGSSALRAQRTLTGLAVLALEGPSERRGIVLAPPERWNPDVGLYRALAVGMGDHPLLRAVTLDDLFSGVPAATGGGGDRVVLDLVPVEPAPFPVTGARYTQAEQDLASLAATVAADAPALEQGARALRLALGSASSPETVATQLAVIDDAVAAVTGGVETSRKRVTLTARRADVPLTFENRTGQPVRVRVHLDSTKLLFPNGAGRVVELPPGVHTERFTVEARASGTFSMMVAVFTADGRIAVGQPSRVTVRSAVFSGVGGALTVGALAFLALWWGNHFRRARRARREVAATT